MRKLIYLLMANAGRMFKKEFLVMKLTFLLIISFSMQLLGGVKGQSVTISARDATVQEVFKQISDQTGYLFFYRDAIFKDAGLLTLEYDDVSINEAVQMCIGNQPIEYSIIDNTIILKLKEPGKTEEISEIEAQQETINITGTVTDENGEPFPGVTVLVKDTHIATATNNLGYYSISAPVTATTIVYSFVGMITREVLIQERNTIDIQMEPSITGIDEVIVTAYGTAKRSSYTGAVSQVNADAIKNRPAADFTSLIEGAGAGIMISGQSGQPGQVQSIRVRGFGSYGASQDPIFMVDGVRFQGNFSAINPNDIESITVLKDAAATALYGNKAANGVVVITTKRGKAGEGRLSVNASYGIITRAIPEYERVDAFDYFPLMWESYRNGMAIPGVSSSEAVEAANLSATNNIFNILGKYNPFNVPNNQIVDVSGNLNPDADYKGDYKEALNWFGALTRVGNRQNYDISYSGGIDKKLDYYVSTGFNAEQGYVIESNLKRFTGNSNVNFQPLKWFKTGLNVRGTITSTEWVNALSSTLYANPIRFARYVAPIYPCYLVDRVTGKYILDDEGNRQFDLVDTRGPGATPGRHPVAEQLWDNDLDKSTSIAAKTYMEVYFLKDFTFTANVSLDERFFYNTWYKNPIIGDGKPLGRSDKQFNQIFSLNLNQLLNYSKKFGKHNIELLLGHESYTYNYNYLYGSKANQVVDDNEELVNFVDIRSLTSYETNYNSEGYLSRVNYDYDQKYLMSASFRRDGSSSFSILNRWGNFWSVSGAWRLDKESFIQGIGLFDLLKLRISYGQLGNDSGIGFYASQALYGLGYNNQGEAGIFQTKLAAQDLVWESNNSTDIAVDYAMFDSRIRGSIGYYNRVSSNLIFSVPLAMSTGMMSRQANIGSLLNEGIECEVSADVLRNSKFAWIIEINLSTLRNVFLKLPQEEIIDGTKKLMVGHGMYDFWLREWYGVDPADGSGLFYAKDVTASNVRVIGTDTLTTLASNARFTYAGSAIPDLFGSFTSNIRYKEFELRAMFTYSIGGKCFDNNWALLMNPGDYGGAKSIDMLRRWQKPGDITDVPRMDDTQVNNFVASSTRFLVDASYLSLRNLSLSYVIPQNFLDKYGISYARVYINGENIFFKSARKGLDPQMNYSGVTANVFTPNRIVSAGLSVNF